MQNRTEKGLSLDPFTSKRPWRPTLPELRVYNYLFSLLDTQLSGVVTTETVSKLLTKSHLHTANARLIVQLADTNKQHKMTRREFYMAMKMVSHAQAEHPISLSNLHEPAPLPVFDGLDLRKVADGKGSSSILRYAPQPTVEVDRIIKCAQDGDAQSIFRMPSLVNHAVHTPPESPTDSLFDMLAASEPPAINMDDSRSVLERTPQLRQYDSETSSRRSSSSSSTSSALSDLHIDTNLPRFVPDIENRSAGAQSVDSVTELLSRIDFMISATHESKNKSNSSQQQLEKSQFLRAELEARMAQLQAQFTAESEHNQQISAKLVSEEESIQTLSAQLVNAQKNIAYVAQQRAQMVDRLRRVEEHQQRIQMQIKQADANNDRNSDDVTLLDNKMFGMGRRMVRMQRHINHSQQQQKHHQGVYRPSTGSSSGSSFAPSTTGTYSASADSVFKRYETTKRNRLSTVFRKQAVA